jgi:hypothetical protein
MPYTGPNLCPWDPTKVFPDVPAWLSNVYYSTLPGNHYGDDLIVDSAKPYNGLASLRLDNPNNYPGCVLAGQVARQASTSGINLPNDGLPHHIVIMAWFYCGNSSSSYNGVADNGIRLGCDFYSSLNGNGYDLGGTSRTDGIIAGTTHDDSTHQTFILWGTNAWALMVMDFTYGPTIPYGDQGLYSPSPYTENQAVTPLSISPWVQVMPENDNGYAWANAMVVMIDPSGSLGGTTYTIAASSDTNSTISPSGSIQVNNGSSQTFTYSADSGYSITQVLVDGSPVSITGSYTFSSVSANHTIVVSTVSSILFTPSVVQSGSASAGSGATSISPSAMGTTPVTGHVIMLTYTESSGDTPVAGDYGIYSISQGGVTWNKAPGCLNDTVNGMVAQVWYGVVGSSGISASMTITLANALPSTGAAEVNYAEFNCQLVSGVDQSALSAYNTSGQSPTFTGQTNPTVAANQLVIGVIGAHSAWGQVTPQNGFALIGGSAVTVGSNIISNAMLWLSVNVIGQYYSGTLFSDGGGHDFLGAIATFPIQSASSVTLTMNSASHGATSPVAGIYSTALGDIAAITAIPASGYILLGWTINGVSNASTANPLSLTITGNMTVTPVFSASSNEILTVTAGSNGSVSPSTNSYNQNTYVTATATPNTGYYLDHWLKDGSTVIPATGNTVTILMDTAHSIQPFFLLSPQPAGFGKSITGVSQLRSGQRSRKQVLTRRA